MVPAASQQGHLLSSYLRCVTICRNSLRDRLGDGVIEGGANSRERGSPIEPIPEICDKCSPHMSEEELIDGQLELLS